MTAVPPESRADIPIPALILLIFREQIRLYEQALDMSQSRMGLLTELASAGEISQAELATRLGMEPTLITRFAKQMEADGWLTRRADPSDNRYTLVTLTEAGQQIVYTMQAFTHTLEDRLLDGLTTAEIATLRDGLKQIQARITGLPSA